MSTAALTVLYPSQDARDAAMPGMHEGADQSFDRLTELLRKM